MSSTTVTRSDTEHREAIASEVDFSVFERAFALSEELTADSGKTRVVIVDDIPETTESLAKLISFESDIEVVGKASDGEQALRVVSETHPDVVLMDICMPVMDGITATEILTSRPGWKAAAVMMSIQGDQDYLRRAILAGAIDYLVKPFFADEFIETIRRMDRRQKQSRSLGANFGHRQL